MAEGRGHLPRHAPRSCAVDPRRHRRLPRRRARRRVRRRVTTDARTRPPPSSSPRTWWAGTSRRLTSCAAARSRAGEGEIVVVIGPNGAGKSTLAKAIFGLVKLREGRVTLRGEDVTGAPPHEVTAQGMSYVPQVANVFGSLTVQENLEVGGVLSEGGHPRADGPHDDPLPAPRRAPPPARRDPLGRRAPDARDGPRPDARPHRCCCSTSRRPASRRGPWARSSRRWATSTGRASRS